MSYFLSILSSHTLASHTLSSNAFAHGQYSCENSTLKIDFKHYIILNIIIPIHNNIFYT